MTTVDDLLAAARARLDRVSPSEAAKLAADGALLVDTRPQWQRDDEGALPGALVIERNHLEWRLDPASDARIPQATDHDVTWIVVLLRGLQLEPRGGVAAGPGPAQRDGPGRRLPRLEGGGPAGRVAAAERTRKRRSVR